MQARAFCALFLIFVFYSIVHSAKLQIWLDAIWKHFCWLILCINCVLLCPCPMRVVIVCFWYACAYKHSILNPFVAFFYYSLPYFDSLKPWSHSYCPILCNLQVSDLWLSNKIGENKEDKNVDIAPPLATRRRTQTFTFFRSTDPCILSHTISCVLRKVDKFYRVNIEVKGTKKRANWTSKRNLT